MCPNRKRRAPAFIKRTVQFILDQKRCGFYLSGMKGTAAFRSTSLGSALKAMELEMLLARTGLAARSKLGITLAGCPKVVELAALTGNSGADGLGVLLASEGRGAGCGKPVLEGTVAEGW